MDKGNKVQSKAGFLLRNAIIDRVLSNGRVQVRHTMQKKVWIGSRPQLSKTLPEKQRITSNYIDVFDSDKLEIVNG